VIILSHSGENLESVKLLTMAQQLGVPSIAITKMGQSRISALATVLLHTITSESVSRLIYPFKNVAALGYQYAGDESLHSAIRRSPAETNPKPRPAFLQSESQILTNNALQPPALLTCSAVNRHGAEWLKSDHPRRMDKCLLPCVFPA
jgi:hypothetical protein